MDLYIDSGTHVDTNLDERRQQIENAIGHPQHVFFEGDESAYSFHAVMSLLLMSVFAPLVAIAAAIQVYIVVELLGRAASRLRPGKIGRDEELVDFLKEEYDIESQEVDVGISRFIFDHKISSAIVNWSGVAFIYINFWPQPPRLISIFGLVVTFLFFGYVYLLLFLGFSHPFRNEYIANSIYEEKEEFNRACLVTGEAHHSAVANLLEKEPGINVINPVPGNPSLLTKFDIWLFKHLNRLQSQIGPYFNAVKKTPFYHVRWLLLTIVLVLGLRYTAIADLVLSQSGNLFLTTLASVQAAIFAIVFSIIILGVNLSASRYSPRLASTFRADPYYRWTVVIFGFSIALNLAGIYTSNFITEQGFNILILASAALAIGAFWTLYEFVNGTLEKTTPEGILTALNQNMTVRSIVDQAHAAADDFRNHDPFLVLISVIRSTISEKDTVSAGKGLDLLTDRVSELVMYADESEFDEGSPVDESLRTVCVDQLSDILEQAKNEEINQIAVKVTKTAEDIGEASVDRGLDSILEYVVRGQTDLIDTIGFDGQDERLREKIMDTCKEILKNAAENQVWSGAAVGVRLLGWLSASSINGRGADENFDRRYTSILILGFPKIVTTVVDSNVGIRDIPISKWIRVHILTDEVEPGQQLIGSCYSSQAELTSAAIRYEIRAEQRFLDWQSVAAGWSDPVEDLHDAGMESVAKLWFGTILYLEFIEAKTPGHVMTGFNPNIRFHLSDQFVLSVVDDILAGEFDPKTRIDFLPGWVDPVEMPLTGTRVSPVQDSDESFQEWLQRRRKVVDASVDSGFGAPNIEELDLEHMGEDNCDG